MPSLVVDIKSYVEIHNFKVLSLNVIRMFEGDHTHVLIQSLLCGITHTSQTNITESEFWLSSPGSDCWYFWPKIWFLNSKLPPQNIPSWFTFTSGFYGWVAATSLLAFTHVYETWSLYDRIYNGYGFIISILPNSLHGQLQLQRKVEILEAF